MQPYKLLICDINIRSKGHYLSYCQYLIDHIEKISEATKKIYEITFGFNLSGQELLLLPEHSNLRFHFFDVPSHSSKAYSDISKIWDMVKNYANDNNFDEMIFMDMDQYQIPIGLSKAKFLISGIYFRPHHRMQTNNAGFIITMKTKIKRVKKILLEKALLSNKKISRIFILNDLNGVRELNSFYKTKSFTYLPDPIFYYNYPNDQISSDLAPLTTDDFKFLIFGAIDERKNITNIVKAFLNTSFNTKTTLFIIGPSDDSYKTYLDDLILENRNPLMIHNEIIIIRRFVTDNEMEYVHKNVNISLLIYKNFYGSSGLIGHAAKHNLFVIASNLGLLNELVIQYKLGITVDPYDVNLISNALKYTAESYISFSIQSKKFYQEHLPVEFAKTLLENNL